jgi:aldehyde:ferredoxin oxidoreductase
MGLGYAVGTRGACHNRAPGYSPDTLQAVDRFTGDADRGPIMASLENRAAIMDSLVICKFIRGVFTGFEAEASRLYQAVTGLETSAETLALSGERICTLRKAFNIREGWTAADDCLPPRALTEALPSGPGQGVRMQAEELEAMISGYYAARGWTPEGLIPKHKLVALGLEDLAGEVGV